MARASVSASATGRDPFMPQQPKGMRAGLGLALLAHALLIAALAFAVHWRSHEPQGVDAELWSAVPQAAAPRAIEPEPQPPAPQPPPPKAAEPKPPPPPVVKAPPAPPPQVDPDIAIEKAKREQAERDKAAQSQREQAKREKLKQAELEREKAEQKIEREKQRLKEEQAKLAAKQKAEAAKEQAAKEEAAREKAEAAREKAEAAREKAEAAKAAAAAAAARDKYLKRMQGMAGATGGESSTGTALRSSGPSAGYAGRIRARIKPNIVFNDPIDGNPIATVEVTLAPDGSIVGKRLLKSSGVKSWDDAVLRAVDRTGMLPRDTDGSVPPKMELEFRPHD
ncbi:MAG: cell envelope integrity protein TolA [Burkholderiaceae bacterium]